jgi:hypothetical protein
MTFWQASQGDFFQLYPLMRVIDVAKVLLCLSMLWTFPMPFFTCREVLIVVLFVPSSISRHHEVDGDHEPITVPHSNHHHNNNNDYHNHISEDDTNATLTEPLLLSEQDHDAIIITPDNETAPPASPPPIAHAITTVHPPSSTVSRFLVPGNDRQLVLVYHILVTVTLWALTTVLAIVAPSLGDVLNLVGCATGTLIAFILPALFSFRLQGYTHLAMLILVVGGAVGLIGTYFSLHKIFFGK